MAKYEKIRVLMVLGNTRRGGTQAFIMNLLRNINKELFQIDLAINNDSDGGWGPEIIALGSKIYIVPSFKVYNWLSYCRFWDAFLEEHHYDIVHGHSTNSAGIYLNIAQKHNCNTISHIHSTGVRGNYCEKIVKTYFRKSTKKYADYWFACSKEAAVKLYGSDYQSNPHYYEIPNGIDVKRFKYSKEIRDIIRKQLGLDEQIFLCGHVGTFSPPKNHNFLIDVFEEICKRRINSKLLLIGEGILKKNIISKAKALGFTDRIIYKENVSDVNKYLMAMDLFIFPSLFEGFGMVSLEAQATGLNVIQSDKVPSETILTECVQSVSLLESPSVWADRGLAMLECDRIKANDVIMRSKYEISKTISLLSRLYEQMVVR